MTNEHDEKGRPMTYWGGKEQSPSNEMVNEDIDPPEPKCTGAPDRIWLVVGDLDEDCKFTDLGEVSWCSDQIGNQDIEYVRADARPAAEPCKSHIDRVHSMCDYLGSTQCEKCPSVTQTAYGSGQHGCFAIAEETIAQADRTAPPPSALRSYAQHKHDCCSHHEFHSHRCDCGLIELLKSGNGYKFKAGDRVTWTNLSRQQRLGTVEMVQNAEATYVVRIDDNLHLSDTSVVKGETELTAVTKGGEV
jgi:hypothetical protein